MSSMELSVREFLDDVEKKLNTPGSIERGRGSVGNLERKALAQYEMFLTEEALQFINRSSSPPVKHWIVSIVGKRQLQSQNRATLDSAMCLFSILLKKAIQDLPASLALAQEIIIYSTRLLSSSLEIILLRSSEPDSDLWGTQTQLNQQILKITESPSPTLRNHALKYLERLIFCFSYNETQGQRDGAETFSLSSIVKPLLRPFSIDSLVELGKNLLDQLINKLVKLAINTKEDPLNANIPNQIVIINSLCIIQSKRARQFSTPIIVGLCNATKSAALSWSNSSQSRSLSYTLRHALISIMHTNKWECGNELVEGLSRLDAKEKAESLYKQLRPLEFRDRKRRTNPNNDVPSAKRQRMEPVQSTQSTTQMQAAMFVMQELDRLVHPISFNPPPFRKPLDNYSLQGLLQELSEVNRAFALMEPAISSIADTNRARDPRARNQAPVTKQPNAVPVSMDTTNDGKGTTTTNHVTQKSKESPAVLPSNEETNLLMRNKAVERILHQELGAKRAGKDHLRRCLVTRFVCLQQDLEHPLVHSVIKFLMDQFPSRIDLAIQWLYQEYYQCLLDGLSVTDRQGDKWEESRENVIQEGSRYNQLLRMILERLCVALQPSKESDPLFRSFILQVPDLSVHTIQTLQEFCAEEEAERVSLGLTSLREIILHRPAARDSTLDLFLHYTVFPTNNATRLNAMEITMESFFPNSELSPKIIQFAQETLLSLSKAEEVEKELLSSVLPVGVPSVIAQEESNLVSPVTASSTEDAISTDDPMRIDDEIDTNVKPIGEEANATVAKTFSIPTNKLLPKHVEQKSQLFVKLCFVDHSLVKKFAEIYVQCIRDVQKILEQQSKELFQSMDQKNEILRELLLNCPAGAETLLLHMLGNIIQDSVIEPELCELLQSACKEQKLDARFLIHTLRVSDKETVLSYLPALVSISSHKLVASAMYSILGTQSGNSLSPTELLVQLHILDKNKNNIEIELKKQVRAIEVCLRAPVVDQKSLAVVLQQLVDVSPIPKIFLRTMISAYKMYPKLEDFILDLLSKLVTKQVWKQPDCWEGFIKCCELAKPRSFTILLQLPPTALKNALGICDSQFRNELLHYCSEIDNVPKQLLSVLDSFKES